MSDSLKSPVLAIDGGGTKSRFALQAADKLLISEAGPANASTDFAGAIACVKGGIAALAQLAETEAEALHGLPAFVGLAGVSGAEAVTRLSAALPLKNACYADDRRAALRGALGKGDGFVAHCGTGSFFAAQIGGRESFAGGWGSVLGDEASAQWVGRMALTQLLRQMDGISRSSALTDVLLSRFQDAAQVMAFARQASPADFGALAPKVTARAAEGDANAQWILQSGADHIASDLRQMGWRPGLAVCLTGGIGPHYAPYLPEDIRTALTPPLGEPLEGAIALAQEKESSHGHC